MHVFSRRRYKAWRYTLLHERKIECVFWLRKDIKDVSSLVLGGGVWVLGTVKKKKRK